MAEKSMTQLFSVSMIRTLKLMNFFPALGSNTNTCLRPLYFFPNDTIKFDGFFPLKARDHLELEWTSLFSTKRPAICNQSDLKRCKTSIIFRLSEAVVMPHTQKQCNQISQLSRDESCCFCREPKRVACFIEQMCMTAHKDQSVPSSIP